MILALQDERDQPVGLCRVFPTERLVDAPGLLPHARITALYERLLLDACYHVGPGPVDLESWGDSPDVIRRYTDLGFEIVERTAGWEVRLG